MTEPSTKGSLSVVVPMEDMEDILVQIWKSRGTEPMMGELYKKYKPLVPPFEADDLYLVGISQSGFDYGHGCAMVLSFKCRVKE